MESNVSSRSFRVPSQNGLEDHSQAREDEQIHLGFDECSHDATNGDGVELGENDDHSPDKDQVRGLIVCHGLFPHGVYGKYYIFKWLMCRVLHEPQVHIDIIIVGGSLLTGQHLALTNALGIVKTKSSSKFAPYYSNL